MALQKEIKSKTGATGNYMAVHAISINNETKRLDYSVALYFDQSAKKAGAAPLEIIYQGSIEKALPENPLAQCYADMAAKASATYEYELPATEEGGEATKQIKPTNQREYDLFFEAKEV